MVTGSVRPVKSLLDHTGRVMVPVSPTIGHDYIAVPRCLIIQLPERVYSRSLPGNSTRD
jgi:hypothetical protein